MSVRWLWAGAAVVLALAAAGSPAQVEDPQVAFEQQVEEAIQKGMDWLAAQQKPDGSFTGLTGDIPYHGTPPTGQIYDHRWGMTAFALFTLLECGMEPDDPVVRKGFQWLGKNFFPYRQTYECASYMMALEALGMARMDRKRDLRNLEPRERAKLQVALTGPEKRIMEQLVNQLLSYHNGSGWRYGNFKSTDKRSGQTTSVNWDTLDGYGIRDLSATQFALLGLKSAIRCRIKIPKDYFQKTIPFILEQQEEEGPQVVRKSGDDDPNTERRDRHATYVPDPRDRARGFAYIRGCQGHEGATSGSMTTAGIASLILCKSELIGTAWMRQDRGVRARQLNQAIWDGLAWLDHNWEIYQNFGYPMNQHYHYYLYGLERVGVLGELHWIGRHHWYSAGAEVLLKTQELTGEWTSGGTPKKERAVPDTCFALLFLKKATVPVGPVLTRDE